MNILNKFRNTKPVVQIAFFLGLIALLILLIGKLNEQQDLRSQASGSAIDLSFDTSVLQIDQNQEFSVDLYADGQGMSAIGTCIEVNSNLQIVSLNSTGVFSTQLLPGTINGNTACIQVGSASPLSGRQRFAELRLRGVQVGASVLQYVNTEAYDISHTESNVGELSNRTFWVGRTVIQNPAAVSLDVINPILSNGQTTTVDVRISTQQRIAAGEFCINYNPSVVQPVSFNPSEHLPVVIESAVLSGGKACITLGANPPSDPTTDPSLRGVTGDFIAGTLTFNAIANGMSAISCGDEMDLAIVNGDGSISAVGSCTGGSISVGATTGGSIPTYIPQPTSVSQPTSVPQPTSAPQPTTGVPQPTSVLPTSGAQCTSDSQCAVSCITSPCPVGKCEANRCVIHPPLCMNITGPGNQRDNIVDQLDLNLALEIWNDQTRNSIIDCNRDGRVSIHDYAVFIAQFGLIEVTADPEE